MRRTLLSSQEEDIIKESRQSVAPVLEMGSGFPYDRYL